MKNPTLILASVMLLISFGSCKKESELVPVLEKAIEFNASKGVYWNAIQLTWKPVPKADAYEVYRLDPITEEFMLVATTGVTEYLDEFETLENALTDVFYKVRAFNSNTEFGAFSDMAYGYYTGRSYDVILSFGEYGETAGGFKFSEHVTVDNEDNYYISETSNAHASVQKFSSNGTFIEQYYICGTPRAFKFLPNNESLVACSSDYRIKILDGSRNVVRQWGAPGTGNGEFNYFRQVAVDGEILYIVDHSNHRIQKMDIYGNFISKWGIEGDGNGEFDYPWGITIYKNMVVVSSDKRLQFFGKDGSFIKSWYFDNIPGLGNLASDEDFLYVAASNVVLKIDENRHFIDRIGSGDGGVGGLALKANGDIVVMDTYGRQVRVYRKNG